MFIPQFNGDRLAFFFYYSNLSTTSLICCLNVLDRRRRTDSNVRVVAGRRGGVGLVLDHRRRTDSSVRVVAGCACICQILILHLFVFRKHIIGVINQLILVIVLFTAELQKK